MYQMHSDMAQMDQIRAMLRTQQCKVKSVMVRGEVGLDFSGNELVSVKDLNISPYSFTIQVWLLFDSNHISADQTILRDVNNRLRIGVTPSAGEVAVEFENYPYSVGNLPIDASGWNFIAIALSMSSAD